MRDHHINVFFRQEDDASIADIPDLEACSAFGSTPQEALADVLRAKQAWIAAAQAAGLDVPTPTYRAHQQV